MSETTNTCPVFCRKCGEPLVQIEKNLHKVEFNDMIAGVKLLYRVRFMCPKRVKSMFFFWHDNRVFNEDCSKEF